MENTKKKGTFLIWLGGYFLLVGSFIIGYNGIEASRRSDLNSEVAALCQELADPFDGDPALDGKLVHVTGTATTEEVLTDPDFKVSANAIRLSRLVNYYQIVEQEEEDLDGNITYYYSQMWTEEPVDSDHFYGDEYAGKNFIIKKFDQWESQASDVRLGSRKLDQGMVWKMENSRALMLDSLDVTALNEEVQKIIGNRGEFVSTYENILYIGADPSYPQVGDVRIIFSIIPQNTVSVVAVAQGDSFVPYEAKNGKKIAWLHDGVYSVDQFVSEEQEDTEYVDRAGWVMGILHILLGSWLLFKGLKRRGTSLPVISAYIWGKRVILSAIVVTAGGSMAIAALGLLFFRPLKALILLALGVAVLFLFWYLRKDEASAMP